MFLALHTVKTVAATWLSIEFASWLGLQYPFSAGIIAILSVLDTNKSSFEAARKRVVSTVLALGIAVILFQIFGFSLGIFAVYLAVYVPSAYLLKVEAGIVPSTVLVTHLLAEESTSLPLLGNELLLTLIGAGFAIALNLYMPSRKKEIIKLRQEADEKIQNILITFSNILLEGYTGDIAIPLDRLKKQLNEAEKLVIMESENRFWKQSDYYFHYIDMRKKQAEILGYMAGNLQLCSLPTRENQILAGLFYLSGIRLGEFNTVDYILEDIQALENYFHHSSLPQTRAEFENRALLLQLFNDFKRFTEIKKTFSKRFSKETLHQNQTEKESVS